MQPVIGRCLVEEALLGGEGGGEAASAQDLNGATVSGHKGASVEG